MSKLVGLGFLAHQVAGCRRQHILDIVPDEGMLMFGDDPRAY